MSDPSAPADSPAARDPSAPADPSVPADPHTTIDPTLPEVVRRFLAAGHQLDAIRLDGAGRWWFKDGPIENARVIALFSRSVDRTEGGTWVLVINRFTYPIEVEATPFFVTRVRLDASGALTVRLNDGSREATSVEALRYVEGGGLHVAVRGGRFEARFSLDVYMDFVESHIEESDDEGAPFVIRVGARRVPLRGVGDA